MVKISEKQKRFVKEYLVDLNATQAAIRAGYSEKTANEQATRLLANVSLSDYLQEQRNRINDKLDFSIDRVMQAYSQIGFFDPRKLFNENGSMKVIAELDDNTAMAISSIEVEELFGNSVDDEGNFTKEQIGWTKKLKFWDKKGALDSICKVQGYNAPVKRDITSKGESINPAEKEKKPSVKLADGTIIEF